MSSQKLFLFDFDGVIVDGMDEYWHSSLLAFEKHLKSPNLIDQNFYKQVSNTFIEMRPWVKYGWEMIIIVHQIIKREDPLNNQNKCDFLNRYNQNCQKVLLENSWGSDELQKGLDAARKYQIDNDFDSWIKLHRPFYEVLDFIERIKKDNIKTVIITTKGRVFASKILKKLNIFPELIFGYESGTKVQITSKLTREFEVMGFIEDRRNTLIDIKQNPITNNIPCYLADWGYLKNTDRLNLPNEIKLLKLKSLEKLLAI